LPTTISFTYKTYDLQITKAIPSKPTEVFPTKGKTSEIFAHEYCKKYANKLVSVKFDPWPYSWNEPYGMSKNNAYQICM
jgi:hypothetical protein